MCARVCVYLNACPHYTDGHKHSGHYPRALELGFLLNFLFSTLVLCAKFLTISLLEERVICIYLLLAYCLLSAAVSTYIFFGISLSSPAALFTTPFLRLYDVKFAFPIFFICFSLWLCSVETYNPYFVSWSAVSNYFTMQWGNKCDCIEEIS